MWKFMVRRVLLMIPQLILLSILVFVLASFMPGDALSGQIDPSLDYETIEKKREELGFNDPWPKKYATWVSGVVKGDFGMSFHHKTKVTDIITDRLINTFWLALLALVITYLIAIPLGIISGRFNDKVIDQFITGYTYLGFATPIFIFALLMVWLFGFHLNWFPTGGSVAPGLTPGTFDYILSKLHHMLLPAISMALIATVGTVQYLRSEIIDTKQKDFILTAQAKGASESRIYNRHIFRNALLPVAAVLGYELVTLIGGSIFVETIFSYPGMGQLFLESITLRDYSVATALVLILGIATIIGTLISDIILSMVDPRIRIK